MRLHYKLQLTLKEIAYNIVKYEISVLKLVLLTSGNNRQGDRELEEELLALKSYSLQYLACQDIYPNEKEE